MFDQLALNFFSENIDPKNYTPADSKITKFTVNPITYHTTIEIEGVSQSIELTVMRTPEGGFNAMINDPTVHGTITEPLNSTMSDMNSAIKSVLTNWENLFLERLKKKR